MSAFSDSPARRDAPGGMTVGALTTIDCLFPPETTCSVISEAFEKQSELPGVLVSGMQDGVVLVSRERFYEQLSQPFGHELFMRRPIRTLATAIAHQGMQIPASMGVDEAAHAALSRPTDRVYEPLVVVDGPAYSILDIHTLLLAQSRLLALANATIQRQMQLAEEANESKSRFLANMSHEIRTPLTAILGFAENLQDPGMPEAERQAAVQTIVRNGVHLLELINDILDLSKIEAGRLDVETVRFSLPQVCSDVMSVMRVRADAKKLPLLLNYDTPVPESMAGDPTRLRQILINLLGNAIKFTQSGRVELKVAVVEGGRSGRLKFDVIDTGIGLTPQQIQRLFEPFVQADSSTTRKFGGTGLGLTISRRLARALGGDVDVSSVIGLGSVFSVTVRAGDLTGVPLVKNPSESLGRTEEERPLDMESVRLNYRILLVEDGPDNQVLVSAFLRKLGADVAIGDNGQRGIELATEAVRAGRPFDLILMDMQMPVMDGYEATRTLRKQGYHRPILALTANAMSGDVTRCLEAGCDDYACKPINRRKLIAQIAEQCTRGPSRSKPAAVAPRPPASGLSEPRPGTSGRIARPLRLDPQVALESVGGDRELLREIAQLFVDHAPKWLRESESAMRAGDPATLRRLTHTLKNSLENLGAKPLSEAAFSIEKAAAAGRLDGAAEALARLDRELAELLPEVQALTTA